jgi:hypothetical protein
VTTQALTGVGGSAGGSTPVRIGVGALAAVGSGVVFPAEEAIVDDVWIGLVVTDLGAITVANITNPWQTILNVEASGSTPGIYIGYRRKLIPQEGASVLSLTSPNMITGVQILYRGCVTSGSPAEVVGTRVAANTIPALTGYTAGDIIVALMAATNRSTGTPVAPVISNVAGPAATQLVNGPTGFYGDGEPYSYKAACAAYEGTGTGDETFTDNATWGRAGVMIALKGA